MNGNNRTEAAIFAGYAKKHAAVAAHRLFNRPEVMAMIADRAEQVVLDAQLSTERWSKEMACIGHFDPRELYDKDGNLIPIHLLPEHVARAIAAVEVERETVRDKKGAIKTVTDDTVKMKFWDKNAALANIGKHLGLFEQDNRQRTNPIQVVVQLVG